MPSCVIIWRVCGAGRVVFHAVLRRFGAVSSCLCMLGIGGSGIVSNILVTQRILKISLIHDIHHSLIFDKIDISPSLAYHFRQLNFTLSRERSDYR